jgi:quinohemoprotein ethanol dehydrogenase
MPDRAIARLMALALAATSGAVSAAESPANVDARRMADPAATAANWMTYGGTYSEQRFSPLKQIDKGNVSRLGLAWFADYDTNLQQDGTPLEIDGVIYVSTAWSKVYAFDARTGKTLWQYDPKTPGQWVRNLCCGIANRGIAAWNGRIYLGTLDGRLVAIDARTGKPAWERLTIDPKQRYSITSAPRVAKGRVLVGLAGGEYGVRGYISAYDAETGKLDWRFYTVPGDPSKGFESKAMEMAARTWSGQWWTLGGGGTTWDALVYDPITNLVYFGVGNGTPWNQDYRDPQGGDNLFLASIVAVNADTGQYVWHYQETPAETWDYDAVSPLCVVDLTIDRQQQRVLLQPSKNGFFYVIAARTGKLLKATPFVELNWADGVDMKTGRPRVKPEARYPQGSQGFNLFPGGAQGAHGWQGNAYSPATGLIYIPTEHAYSPMVYDPNYKVSDTGTNLGIQFRARPAWYAAHPEKKRTSTSLLQAWDPKTGRQVWAGDEGQGANGGAVATAGELVFEGNGAGHQLRAFDARTGKVLWAFDAQTAVLASPISYELDGKQYIAVSVGGNASDYYAPNYSRLLVFALEGKAKLPATQPYTPRPLMPPPLDAQATAADVQAGEQLYARNCLMCHGDRGRQARGLFPDLTRTPMLYTQDGFNAVVLQGQLSTRGMASFGDALKPEDTFRIRNFLIDAANKLKATPPPAAPAGADTHGQQQ